MPHCVCVCVVCPLHDRPNTSYENWFDYMRPIVDRALPAKLLDFLDFHAYTANADPKVCGK